MNAPHRARGVSACALALLLLTAHAATAQVGVRPADQWIPLLESRERIEGMQIPALIEALGITPGMVVADVGAGSGLLTGYLAEAAGPTGVVFASDIDQALLDHITQRARTADVGTIRTVLGTFTDPRLPQPVDVALMNDVLHHVESRAAYMRAVARHLKPGGRLAIIDYTAAGSPHQGNDSLIVTEAQVDAWAAAAGLARTRSVPLYDDRYFVIYTKP